MGDQFNGPPPRGERDEFSGVHGPLPLHRPRGVLLDVDGTLLDSNGAHARAWLEALMGEGIALPCELLRRELGKGGEPRLWEVLKIDPHSVLGKTISRHRREIFKTSYLAEVAPFPGSRRLLARMRADGLSIHATTSSSDDDVNDLLRAAGVSDLVDRVVTTTDLAARVLLDPDIVSAIARSGLPRHELLMLGDTPYDVRAAILAGVPIVAVRSGGFRDRDLVGAIEVYDDVADLLSSWEQSAFVGATTRVQRSG